jgi:protein SCO1/2
VSRLRRGLALGLLAATLAACGGGGSSPSSAPVAVLDGGGGTLAPTALRGDPLSPPTSLPHIVLTDTSGHRYDVAAQQHGRVLLMYFGYTHCPDLCPLFMADIASAVRQLPASVQKQVTVDFVSVDPKRDTLSVIRRWLDHFSRRFVGLRGGIHQVIAAQRALQIPVSKVDPHAKQGYTVEHSAELLVFDPDHEAHVAYTVGPDTIGDLTHDLPLLVDGKATT